MRSWRIRAVGLVLLACIATATPAAGACAPDERYLDAPDGMEYHPATCELSDLLDTDAQVIARDLGVTPAAARAWLEAIQRLDPVMGRIAVRDPDTFAGFPWTWTGDTVTLLARFKGSIPPAVVAELADAGVEVRYVVVAYSAAELDALATTTFILLGQVSSDWAAGVDGAQQRVVASVSADGLTLRERVRLWAFVAAHPTVDIDIVDGPVVILF